MSDDNSLERLRRELLREVLRIRRADFRTFDTATLRRAFGEEYESLPEGYEIIDYPSGQSDVINLRAKGAGNG
jgi:hypothetical protein